MSGLLQGLLFHCVYLKKSTVQVHRQETHTRNMDIVRINRKGRFIMCAPFLLLMYIYVCVYVHTHGEISCFFEVRLAAGIEWLSSSLVGRIKQREPETTTQHSLTVHTQSISLTVHRVFFRCSFEVYIDTRIKIKWRSSSLVG